MTPPCRGRDTERWFSPNREDREYAINHCLACPLQAACLEEALRVESLGPVTKGRVCGIYGGVTANQRLRLIVPRCSRCHGPRQPKHPYCPDCVVIVRRESQQRHNERKRTGRV
jgi:tRNA A37 threonylcarbamoyltransferase TsaD